MKKNKLHNLIQHDPKPGGIEYLHWIFVLLPALLTTTMLIHTVGLFLAAVINGVVTGAIYLSFRYYDNVYDKKNRHIKIKNIHPGYDSITWRVE